MLTLSILLITLLISCNLLQDMTPEDNLRLQHLFEDSMATLTQAVETLSQSLTNELLSLSNLIATAQAAQNEDPVAVRSASTN